MVFPAQLYGKSIFEGLATYIAEEPWVFYTDTNAIYSNPNNFDFTNIAESTIKLCQMDGKDMNYMMFNTHTNEKYAIAIYSDYILTFTDGKI